MKMIVLDGEALNPGDLSWEGLSALGTLTVYDRTDTLEEAIARVGEGEVLMVNKFPVSEALLAACPSVKLVCVLATGYNVVDCAAARSRGIPVCNVPAYGTDAVAQFTLGLMLELCHRIGLHDASVHRGDWNRCPNFCYWLTPQMELRGKTLGIIGFGRIGRAVARMARAFGMEVLAYSRSRCPEGEALAEYVDLDTLLKRSHIISLHCPLFPETKGIINEHTIAKMRPGAFLINTARGPLIDEGAVAEALRTGKLAGAALDVVSEEPIANDNVLLTAPNCILTPHIAWAPVESRQRLMDIVIANIRAYQSGTPQNVVN